MIIGDDDVGVRLNHKEMEWKAAERSNVWMEKKYTFDAADSENGKNCISKMKTRVEWRENRACMFSISIASLADVAASAESHIRNIFVFAFAFLPPSKFSFAIFLFRLVFAVQIFISVIIT